MLPHGSREMSMQQIWNTWFPIIINATISIFAYYFTLRLIPRIRATFLKANLFGIDMNKRTGDKVPEALGVVSGCIFLIALFLFIPFPYCTSILFDDEEFPHNEFVELIAALLSICCMILLGFADDVLDLKWRYKLMLPTIASMPLLMVYFVNFNSTTVVLPNVFGLRETFGYSINIGLFYYVYMGMLAVFCTNAINILAGVNGLEAGQSIVIAVSITVFNLIELSSSHWKAHQFSLYFMLPYIATSLALLRHNWYPSKVFVGDTFCYLSGMTFAVVGILGHFSKSTLLFFIPQIVNFLYSIPQLFRLVPCPRHRMPKFNSKIDKLIVSNTTFHADEIGILGKLVLWVFRTFRLVKWEEKNKVITINNLTLINFVLHYFGPMHEAKLTTTLIFIQIISSTLAFIIRYPLANYFYE